jgi:hypothetical protein
MTKIEYTLTAEPVEAPRRLRSIRCARHAMSMAQILRPQSQGDGCTAVENCLHCLSP